MTGARLLYALIEQMQICSPIELANFCLRQTAAAEPVRTLSSQLVALVAEPDENKFWEILSRHEWLLALVPADGSPKKIIWDELSAQLPKEMQQSHQVLPTELFRSIVELFVWWFYAPVYAGLVLELDEVVEAKPSKTTSAKPKKPPKSASSKGEHTLRQARWGGDESLGIYLREIGEIPLITAAEEVRLAQKIKFGDKKCFRHGHFAPPD